MLANPFKLVYDGLWDLAWSWQNLCDLVKPSNRITFAGDDRDPIKPEIAAADLPELRLVPIGGAQQIHRSSSSSYWKARYEWQVSTGDYRTNEHLWPVQWELYRALSGWLTPLRAIKWPKSNPKSFVTLMNLTSSTEGVSDQDLRRGIDGWSSVMTCEVDMHFATADLANPDY